MLCFAFIKLPAYQRKPWTAKTLFWDLDVVGFTILAPACVMLLLAIQWGGIDYAWSSATIIGMLCGSIASFASFVVWEMRMKDQAMVPQSLVRRRPLAFAVLAAYFQGGGMVIITYYLPLFFQAVDGVSPTLSGVRLLPLFLGQLITAAIVGSLSEYKIWATGKTAYMCNSVENGIFRTRSNDSGPGFDRHLLRVIQLHPTR